MRIMVHDAVVVVVAKSGMSGHQLLSGSLTQGKDQAGQEKNSDGVQLL